MGIIREQSIKSTIYIYTGVIIGFVTTGILMPHFLTESENGVLKLLVSYSMLFAQLGSLGLPMAAIKFFPFFRDKQSRHFGYFFFLTIIGLLGFILFISIFPSIENIIYQREVEKSPLFAEYLYLIIPLTFFFLYFNIIDVYARSLLFSVIGAFLKEVLQRVFILICLLFFIFDLIDYKWFLYAYVISISLPTVIIFLFLAFKKEISFKITSSKFTKGFLKQFASVAAFGLFLGISSIAISQIDSIMINYYLNDAKTGIYAITFYYGALILMPSRAIFRITSTIISEASKSNNESIIRDIQFKSCLNQYIMGIGLFFLLWLNIENVFKILPPEYLEGKYVIFFIGIANVIQMSGGVSSQIISYSKYYRFSGIFISIYLVLIILTNVIMIPIYGIMGAAIASMSSVLLFNLMKYFFIWKKYSFQPYNYKYLLILIFVLSIYAAIYLIPLPEALIPNLLIKSSIFGSLYILFIYKSGYSKDISNLIDTFWTKFFK